MTQILHPIILQDDFVQLIPMQLEHAIGLYQAGRYAEIWKWTIEPYCFTLKLTERWITDQLFTAKSGAMQPMVIVDKVKGCIVGSTSYLNISEIHKSIEIGFTFLSPSAQNTHINRRCKWLLFQHAFERLKMNRVAFQTHEKNTQSRTAIEGLGATLEGILRNNRIGHNGAIRSSAVYSIIAPEWPRVKQDLLLKIQ